MFRPCVNWRRVGPSLAKFGIDGIDVLQMVRQHWTIFGPPGFFRVEAQVPERHAARSILEAENI